MKEQLWMLIHQFVNASVSINDEEVPEENWIKYDAALAALEVFIEEYV